MPDLIDQTTTNPQSLVDAALGTEPVVSESPMTPPPLAPLAPLTPPPLTPLSPLTSETMPTPAATPTPSQTPPPSPASVPMGDDTPLAFATMTPSSTSIPTTSPIASPDPLSVQTSSYLPPAPTQTMSPEQPKKNKGKVGLIVGGVVALLLFVVGGIAGYQYISTGEVPMIAKLDYFQALEKQREKEAGPGGYKAQINANQAAGGGFAGGGTGANSNANVGSDIEKQGQIQAIANSAAQAAKEAGQTKDQQDAIIKKITEAAYSGGLYNSVADAQLEANKVKANIPVAKNAGTYEGKDAQGNAIRVYIDAPGVFEAALYRAQYANNPDDLNVLKTTYHMTDRNIAEAASKWAAGMTWVPGGVGCSGIPGQQDPTSPNYCMGFHWTTCASGNGKNGIGCSGFTNNSPGDNTTITTDTPPTMSCTGLTSVPATTPTAPLIGAKVVFTCAGAVVPATAGTLTYKFRYSIDAGTYKTLVNKTATTAELTIAACGAYSVECQACATLAGVVTCDPIWTGAAAQ